MSSSSIVLTWQRVGRLGGVGSTLTVFGESACWRKAPPPAHGPGPWASDHHAPGCAGLTGTRPRSRCRAAGEGGGCASTRGRHGAGHDFTGGRPRLQAPPPPPGQLEPFEGAGRVIVRAALARQTLPELVHDVQVVVALARRLQECGGGQGGEGAHGERCMRSGTHHGSIKGMPATRTTIDALSYLRGRGSQAAHRGSQADLDASRDGSA